MEKSASGEFGRSLFNNSPLRDRASANPAEASTNMPEMQSTTHVFGSGAKLLLDQLLLGKEQNNAISHIVPSERNRQSSSDIQPPTFSTRVQTEPPVYAPAGGFFYKGLIYLVSRGGSTNLSFGGGVPQYPGIYTWDPQTGHTQALLNNYFGLQFNTLDDLFVHPITGDVWFTHNLYSWIVGRTAFSTVPPQLGPAVYRFNNATGRVFIIEDTLSIPNGISLSPDQKTVYIGDSGAVAGNVDPSQPPGLTFDTRGKRTIYAYDVGGNGTYLSNRRAVYQTQDLVPDGLKVAANGYLVTISGRGADVVDPQGDLLVRVQTSFTVENLVFAGEDLNELWLTGTEAIARVRWALQGQQPVE